MKNKKVIYQIIATIVILSMVIVGGYYIDRTNTTVSNNVINSNNNTNIIPPNNMSKVGEIPENFNLDNNNLQIFFFDVGQADSCLIIDKDTTMLIDAGKDDDGLLLVEYIKELGITDIDYIIGTHDHEDHIGGIDKIVNAFDIGSIYTPKVTNSSKQYKEIVTALENKGKTIQTVEKGKQFKIGDAIGVVKFVDNIEPSNPNNSSIILQITIRRTRLPIYG